MLKALVIMLNEKNSEVGGILAIARDAARRRENVKMNPPILALDFIAELDIFVAVYEAAEKSNPDQKSMG